MTAESVTFQLTASRRGWHLTLIQDHTGITYFNSQPHEEADNVSLHTATIRHISTHSLTKRLTRISIHVKIPISYFNSQPHEEADVYCRRGGSCNFYFNSQPHEEADFNIWILLALIFISTHSLTKRLTNPAKENAGNVYISTHSLTKRLTYNSVLTVSSVFISTHSLTKRLTVFCCTRTGTKSFQLTASRRGWRPEDFFPVINSVFQLTASRRGWQCELCLGCISLYFNSQPHEEADGFILCW